MIHLLGPEQVDWTGPAAFESRVNNSVTRPCSARGAGSTPRLVNLYHTNHKNQLQLSCLFSYDSAHAYF